MEGAEDGDRVGRVDGRNVGREVGSGVGACIQVTLSVMPPDTHARVSGRANVVAILTADGVVVGERLGLVGAWTTGGFKYSRHERIRRRRGCLSGPASTDHGGLEGRAPRWRLAGRRARLEGWVLSQTRTAFSSVPPPVVLRQERLFREAVDGKKPDHDL